MERAWKINQLGYLVDNVEEAVNYWLELGIGPWFITMVEPDNCVYRGEPTKTVMRTALANSGDLQLELIQDMSEGPSFYKECLDANRKGIHHVSYWWAPEEFETACKELIDDGYVKAWSGETGGPEGACAYFEHKEHPGVIYEVSALSDIKEAQFEYIAEEAKDWDGTDPVRIIG